MHHIFLKLMTPLLARWVIMIVRPGSSNGIMMRFQQNRILKMENTKGIIHLLKVLKSILKLKLLTCLTKTKTRSVSRRAKYPFCEIIIVNFGVECR